MKNYWYIITIAIVSLCINTINCMKKTANSSFPSLIWCADEITKQNNENGLIGYSIVKGSQKLELRKDGLSTYSGSCTIKNSSNNQVQYLSTEDAERYFSLIETVIKYKTNRKK